MDILELFGAMNNEGALYIWSMGLVPFGLYGCMEWEYTQDYSQPAWHRCIGIF